MEQKDPTELVEEVQEEQRRRGDIASEALAWFLDGRIGSFYPRQEAVEELSETLDIPQTAADTAIADTVGDVVDPVQQIVLSGERFVGVIGYRVYESEGAYGYVDFDDRKGKRNRVVCARCVEKYDYDEQIRHATQGEGSLSPGATWQDLLDAITAHYADSHTRPPTDIEPGASLVSGTTIGGNTAFHTGNLADRGAVTITPSTTNQTIPQGFHNGNGFVEGDAELVANNIRSGTQIFGVSGNIIKPPDTQIIRLEDNNTSSLSFRSGCVISPNADMEGVRADISTNTSGASQAYITDDTETVLDSVDISSLSAGDTFSLSASLTAGSNYFLYLFNGGSSFTAGSHQDDGSQFPYTGAAFDITAGYASVPDSSRIFCVNSIRTLAYVG